MNALITEPFTVTFFGFVTNSADTSKTGSGTLLGSQTKSGTASGSSSGSGVSVGKKQGAVNNLGTSSKAAGSNGSTSSATLNNTGSSIRVESGSNYDSIRIGTTYSIENSSAIANKKVEMFYSVRDSLGNVAFYGTYDSTKDIAKFQSFGLLLCLFIFSTYLFHVSARLYHEYFDKKEQVIFSSTFFLLCIIGANILAVCLVPIMKGMPMMLLLDEFLEYPNEFILVMGLSSLLLFAFGILRFAMIAIVPNSKESPKKLKDTRFSIVGLVVGALSAAANIAKLWEFFKK